MHVKMAGKGKTAANLVVLSTRTSLATYMANVSTTLVCVTKTI